MPPHPPFSTLNEEDVENVAIQRNYSTFESPNQKGIASETDELLPTQQPEKERSTYDLSFPFRLMSGTVWFSMFLWGIWIATFYSMAVFCKEYSNMNIVFPDLFVPTFPIATIAIAIHFIGAAYMSFAGAFQLVKYIRKHYAVLHRWSGRIYIASSVIASVGGLMFIFFKGSYGGKQADYAFATYGLIFFVSGIMTYYYALQKDYRLHKLWAWRLYSLSLAGWMYRADYYFWMGLFGIKEDSWLHNETYRGPIDLWINWAFYVPNLIIVEIYFRWGENATLPLAVHRVLDVCYYCVFVMTVVFTLHAAMQLWVPSVIGTYNKETGWIM